MSNLPLPANLVSTYIPYYPAFVGFPACQPWRLPITNPVDSSDVYRRSAARLFALNHLEELVVKIAPYGFRQGKVYQSGNLLVALDYTIEPRCGMSLLPGMWMDGTGCFGFDLVHLYAGIHGVDYSKAASAIFDAYRDPCESGLRQVRKPPQWTQDLHPLYNQSADWPMPGVPHPSDVCIFRNAAGQLIAALVRRPTISGQCAYVYSTLWRRSGSSRSMWAEIFPSESFFLNANTMHRLPKSPVHVTLDPFEAKQKTEPGSSWIFTALPSGPTSMLDADLGLLSGRDIRVDLDLPGVESIFKIDSALKSARVASVTYALPKRAERYLDVEQASKVAENDGFILKACKDADRRHVSDAIIVAKPGQPVPGAELQRDMLLQPFLKEGYLAWLYAPEKTGKSWVASAIAQAVATGRGVIGAWTASKRGGVLLVDGEMLPDELNDTIRLVSAGLDAKHKEPMFEVMCAKSQSSGLIDIEDEEWQHYIEKRLVGKKLLILDNLQSLMANGGTRLNLVQGWLRRITQKGIAVLVLDHTNADGELQGSIAKRRIANVVISMKCENDEARANGITMVTYEAARRLHGQEAHPFLLRRIHEEGSVKFEVLKREACEPVKAEVSERIRKMATVVCARNRGKTFREILDKDNNIIPPATATGLVKAAAELKGEDLRQFEAEIARLTNEGVCNSAK